MNAPERISVEGLDRRFDDGEDVSEYFDWSRATRPGLETEHLDIDLPAGMVRDLDANAERHGVTRQALIKRWLADRLKAAG